MRLRELFSEGVFKQIAQDLLHASDSEFIRLYGKPKQAFQQTAQQAAKPASTASTATSDWTKQDVINMFVTSKNPSRAHLSPEERARMGASAWEAGWRPSWPKPTKETVNPNLMAPWGATGARFKQM